MRLTEKIGRIPYIRALKHLAGSMGVDVYLVGGFLRDLYLAKTKECFDFDFAVQNNVLAFAKKFSQIIKSRLVVLDEEGRTYRVVLKKKDAVYNYDFAKLRGTDLQEDVLRRDFILNTLCMSVNEWPTIKIIDCLGAKKDIKKRVVRVINGGVLVDDPLRILRAFSISSRYTMRIEEKTISL